MDVMDSTLDTIILPSPDDEAHGDLIVTFHHGHHDVTLFLFVPVGVN